MFLSAFFNVRVYINSLGGQAGTSGPGVVIKINLHTRHSTGPETAQETLSNKPKSGLFKQLLGEPMGHCQSVAHAIHIVENVLARNSLVCETVVVPVDDQMRLSCF